MKRLKNVHQNDRAAIIFGGPSLLEQNVDFQVLRDKKYVVFLESQALTPWFLNRGVQPDYYLMLFPDKCHGNSLHNFIFRGLLAGIDPGWFIKKSHRSVVRQMKTDHSHYFEPWKPHKGPHKRFRWRPGMFMPESPYDLLGSMNSDVKIIANKSILDDRFPGSELDNPMHLFQVSNQVEDFDVDRYYEPDESLELLTLRNMSFVNSAAVGLYPLLKFMGFKEVFFFGMDMSMLGSFEYSAPYSFKTMWHFQTYFWRSSRAFNANYVRNRPYYLRPPYEFENIKQLLSYNNIRFTRVHDPHRWAAPSIDGIKTIAHDEFSGK